MLIYLLKSQLITGKGVNSCYRLHSSPRPLIVSDLHQVRYGGLKGFGKSANSSVDQDINSGHSRICCLNRLAQGKNN